MPISLSAPLESLRQGKSLRFASCWKLERSDGTIYYFTNHDKKITFDGHDYTPAGGFNASARQKNTELSDDNMSIAGMISSGAITEDDLRAGRYRNTKITEYLVDWKYPWLGAFMTSSYWIMNPVFTGEVWNAELQGVTRWLAPKVGDVYGRQCRHELGDTSCGIVLSGIKESGTVSVINIERQDFDATGLSTATTDYFNYGKLTWTSGNNNGLSFDVKDYTGGDNILLQLLTPFDIEVGDTFDIYPGCDKLKETCNTKFSNIVNYGGFPFIPGTDRATATPKAR